MLIDWLFDIIIMFRFFKSFFFSYKYYKWLAERKIIIDHQEDPIIVQIAKIKTNVNVKNLRKTR